MLSLGDDSTTVIEGAPGKPGARGENGDKGNHTLLRWVNSTNYLIMQFIMKAKYMVPFRTKSVERNTIWIFAFHQLQYFK